MPSEQVDLSFSEKSIEKEFPWSKKKVRSVYLKILALLKKDPKALELRKIWGSLAVFVCDDKQMRSFQKKFRKLDRSTDVLSFPTFEMPGWEQSANIESELGLGSLVLSWPAICRGARRGRRSEEAELLEVFIHGVLHLMGYDHVLSNKGVTLQKAQKMRNLQKKLFLVLSADIKNSSYVRKKLA